MLLAHHGLLACGADLAGAFNVAEQVEYCAEIYWRARAIGSACSDTGQGNGYDHRKIRRLRPDLTSEDYLMKTALKIILISCGCWLLFALLDFIVLALYALKYDSLSNISFLLLRCIQVSLCFVVIGAVSGVLACAFYSVAKFFDKSQKYHAAAFALSTALALSCTLNIFLLNPCSVQFRHSVTIIGFCILSISVFLFIFMSLCRGCKEFKIAIIAFCLSVELFWGIVRICSKGFLVQGLTESQGIIFFAAVLAASALFFILYFFIPRFSRQLKKMLPLFAAFLLIFVLSVNGYSSGEKRPVTHIDKQQATRPNIVLIIIDTVRADHISSYGYAKTTTPHIDQFAQESLRFEKAYAAASWTLPSTASLLTGTYSGYHGAHRNDSAENFFSSNKLSDENVTLAEVLGQYGYYTASIVSSPFLGRQFGLDQGFQYLDDIIPNHFYIFPAFAVVEFLNSFFPLQDYLAATGFFGHKVADQINLCALNWLKNYDSPKPFFLLLHYFDPHDPYLPENLGVSSKHIPATIVSRYGQRTANYTDLEKGLISTVMNNEKPLLHDEHDLLINNYDLEISRNDQKVNEILEACKALNVYDNSIIVILSDHGESFGEHDLMLHGVSLYEDNLMVPLLIKLPLSDLKKGVITRDVSLVGLVPTILSYLDIPIPETVQGSSFFGNDEQRIVAQNFRDPKWKNQEITRRFDQDIISLKLGRYKFIRSTGGKTELFDLEQDPLELHDLLEKETGIAKNISAHLESLITRFGLIKNNTKKNQSDVDSGTIQNLKTLGYIK